MREILLKKKKLNFVTVANRHKKKKIAIPKWSLSDKKIKTFLIKNFFFLKKSNKINLAIKKKNLLKACIKKYKWKKM